MLEPEDLAKTSPCSSGSSSRVPTLSAKFLRTESTTSIADEIIDHIPPRRVSSLPVEVLDNIFQFLTQDKLVSLLPINKCLYAISARQLYHTISVHGAWQSIAFFRAALNNPTIPPLVRSLDIDISESYPLRSFYLILHKVLQRLPSLVSLFLDFPKYHSPLVWILHGCTFSLKKFTTSMHCALPLALFLDTQPNITHLTLRGFQNNNASMLPFTLDVNVPTEREPFKLKPTSLPNLTHFNAIHVGPSVIQAVVKDRPVEVVSIPLFPSFSIDSLSALTYSSVPMRRLSIISFDPDAPNILFQVLSDHFEYLEAIHVVFLMTDYTKELLERSGSLLRHFKSLKYITFMAASPDETLNIDESIIVKQWHKSCPTLRTIILPRGRVWFPETTDKVDPDWDCLPDPS